MSGLDDRARQDPPVPGCPELPVPTVQLRVLSKSKDQSIRRDRRANFQSMLRAASCAAARGDSRSLQRIVHQAAGNAPEPHKGLRDKSGCLLTDATDIEARWVEHYTELLLAQPITEETTGSGECVRTYEPGLAVGFAAILTRVESRARPVAPTGFLQSCFRQVEATRPDT